VAVEAAAAAPFGCFHRLAVQDHDHRAGVPTGAARARR
jgi:hypothetical protein